MADLQIKSGKNLKITGSRRILHNINRYKYLYLLAAPGLIAIILFSYVPLYGLQLAFKEYRYVDGIWGSPWVGMQHFKILMSTPEFIRILKNTVVISFSRLIWGFPTPIILALLLNELRNYRFKTTIQSILYLPHFLSWVVMAGIIFNILSLNTGVINNILAHFGLKRFMFLGNAKTFRPLLYITDIWKESGWGTIIYLAAIAGIDTEVYESAVIDGANRFKQVIYITLPSLSYAIVVLIILSVGGLMDAGFDQIFNLMNAPTQAVGDIIDTYVYRMGIVNARYDFTTAVGLFKNIINCILLFTTNQIVKTLGHEGFM